MALQSVFAQGPHFGSGHTSDPNQDENHEREETEGDEDLEEGEIADDDEEEPALVDKLTKNDDKKEEAKSNGSSTATAASKTVGVDKSDSKFSSASSASAADSKKREPKRRARKRGSDDEHPDSRDMLRKRRRNQDDGEGDDDEMEMMDVRGHSPSERERLRFETGDYEGSDFDASPTSMPTPSRRPSRAERSERSERADRPERLERPDRQDRPERAERVRPGGRTSPRRRARGNSRERERDRRRGGDRDRDRDRGGRPPPKNSNSSMSKMKDESICAFYMEGKCSRGSDCPYSHAALPPRKMELCKFYLMDCCAKKEKCLYMHKDFPCKYFHTGKKCRHGAEDCKFSHDSLSETHRAILIKHIETAPREILGDFPRLTRDETIQAIDNFSPQGNGRDKRPHIPSLFDVHLGSGTSQPVKTETLPKEMAEERIVPEDSTSTNRRVGFYQDTNAENVSAEENRSPENSRSIWFGQLRQEDKGMERQAIRPLEETKPAAEIVAEQRFTNEEKKAMDYMATLPRRQRELFLRIQQQQREPTSIDADSEAAEEDKPADDQWYSSDEEGEGRSLSDVLKSIKQEPESHSKTPAVDSKSIAPNIDLGSLENINVAEIAKALSVLQSKNNSLPTQSSSAAVAASASSPEEPPISETGRRDPRIRNARSRPPTQSVSSNMGDVDLRMQSRGDVDLRIGNAPMNTDVDLRSTAGTLPAGLAPLGSLDEIGSADIDLRRFGLPFKAVTSHPPATEINASYSSHSPIEYQVYIVDCEPRNYALIRVHADWASLDPRLQRDHSSERTSYSGADVPSIPLGPASPDPVVPSRPIHYEPEPVAFSGSRWAPNDPRTRDPRRAAAAAAVSSSPLSGTQHQTGSLADPRGKPGLLGAAPPGMLPYGNKNELANEPTSYGSVNSGGVGFRQTSSGPYDRPYESGTAVAGSGVAASTIGGQQSPRAENRRDPRQRLRNPPATAVSDTDSRSYTPPPPNERVFR